MSSNTQNTKNEFSKKPKRNLVLDSCFMDQGLTTGIQSFETGFETYQTQEWWLLELLWVLEFTLQEIFKQPQDMQVEEISIFNLEQILKDGFIRLLPLPQSLESSKSLQNLNIHDQAFMAIMEHKTNLELTSYLRTITWCFDIWLYMIHHLKEMI